MTSTLSQPWAGESADLPSDDAVVLQRARVVHRVRPARPSTMTAALKAAGMTRVQLAHTMHVSRPTIYQWENGRRQPARHYWPSLATALGLTLDEVAALFADHPPARYDGTPLPSLAFERHRVGLTQRALAQSVGVAPTTLAMWETAGVRVPLGVVDEIARQLDTTVARLAGRPPSVADVDSRPLRRLRKNTGMSQREAAAHLGIAIGTLARYESGERPTPVAAVRRMATLYRCPMEAVLRYSGRTLLPLPPGVVWREEQVPEGIRAARLAAGLTKAALGRALGTSAQAVHKWERGLTRPRTSTCRRLEALFGLPVGKIPYSNRPPAGSSRGRVD
jgi:transcriptional regulator with XRE-family HTH domain